MKNFRATDFKLPIDHEPYLVLEKGGSGPFSCAHCSFLSSKGNEYHCSNGHYQKFMGGSLLKDENGKPLEDPSRACSDWFEEK